ncbi:MAG: DNA translocase FtsK [Candidatus Margulisbacteria bacterium]|jgi:S-DNA-T family DNA segregation ATPase FtsK/SpoIIIE|nr:DNA translocase FtsK [Candidatus Margulisiibacteriota bacterium]
MPPKKSKSAPKKPAAREPRLPSRFKQDIVAILLIAVAIFIFLANLSSSTGLLGLFIIKKALRSAIGVGIYLMPAFIALYGVIMLLRHEVKELTVRLTGLLVMFLVFISIAQFAAPQYFDRITTHELAKGGGGVIGYAVAFSLEKTIGLAGAYVFLSALALIAALLMFNVTVQSLIDWFYGLLHFDRTEPVESPKKAAAKELAIKNVKPVAQEVIPAPPIEPDKPKPIVEVVLPKTPAEPVRKAEAKAKAEGDGPVDARYEDYVLPSLDLLEDSTAKERAAAEKSKALTQERAKLLEQALRNFGIAATVVAIYQGPAVTRYELQPEPGVKVSRINSLADDIALAMAAQGIRIEAPVPGKSVIGIEVPNQTVTPVRLKEIINTNEFMHHASKLVFGLGKDLSGHPIYGDIGKMPHLLIAGTTGSGKSVCINSIITSVLMRARPDEVKMLMIDPKMVELSIYDGIAHLLAPVVTDAGKAAIMLKEWVIKEMERRYKLFHAVGARHLDAYNEKIKDEPKLPYIMVIVDELADLMMVAAKHVEPAICRIAQMSRATGIHLVIATQRPSVDVITGLIKANIPSRIAFAVATQIDSRVILDASGAEVLLGRGDMLYNPIGAMKPTRAQGSFVTDKETEKIIKHVKAQAEPEYLEEIIGIKAIDFGKENADGERETGGGKDALFADVAQLIIESGQASTSYVQRKFRIGYNRAARLMDEMEQAGLVSAPEGDLKVRRITATREILKTLGIGA